MLPRGSRWPLLLIAAAVAGLSACGSDNDVGFRPLAPGDTYALTSGNRLISFNRSSPGTRRSNALITGIGAGESLIGVDFRPANGMLYGVDTAGAIYTIDTASGVATQVLDGGDPVVITGATLAGTTFGVDFNPVPDRLRIVSDSGQNLRVNVDTGATIVDGALTLNSVSAAGIAAAAYTNSFSATCRTALFYLDASNNTLLSTSAPNDGVLSSVGPLGVTGAISAFEISTSSTGANSAFATIAANGASTLYSVNTTTGAATARGLIAAPAGETVLGLAMAPPATAPAQAAGELFGLTESNRLVSFNRSAPSKLCTNELVTGLGTREDLVGIDFRPATGELYGLTADDANTGRLYTIDTATAVATSAATAPVSETLLGSTFGVDFNPVPDRLRVVSDMGQNLRINVDTGVAIVDGTLNGAATGASAAAYTNSVAGAGTTTLYVLDASGATDTLYTQNPPNDGTLVMPLATGLDLTSVNGFDIDGRDNVALLAGAAMGESVSTLYTVNLGSGATTSLGAVGSGSGLVEGLRGLARPTPATTVFGLRDNPSGTGQQLVTVSMADPATVQPIGVITGTGGETLVGIDFRPLDGLLYGVSSEGSLFTINTQTGLASGVGLMDATTSTPLADLSGAAFGVDFNPVPNALRIVSDAEQNLRVSNVATGATITDGTLARDPSDSSFALGAVAYTNSTGPGAPNGVTSTTLYAIDATTDRLVAINPPNDGVVRVIGPLGIDAVETSAFDIIGPPSGTSPGIAVAILDTVTQPQQLYSINLSTGAATLIPAPDLPASTVLGLAAPISSMAPAADSQVFVIETNNLVSFARDTGERVVDVGITGLAGAAGEAVVGMDFRPATGALYVLTRDTAGTGRLYTLDTATGAAALSSTLDTVLGDTQFGVDFNPVPDRLRIIGSTGQNLRVNVETGAAIVDGTVNQPTPNVHAAAYINSFSPQNMAGTLLYVIDAATGSLLTQNPANDGTLFNVGALSAGNSFSSVSGFDIAGGANGIVLAALQLGAETSSRLYRINLATGAATEVSSGVFIGGASAPLLDGLAIRIQ